MHRRWWQRILGAANNTAGRVQGGTTQQADTMAEYMVGQHSKQIQGGTSQQADTMSEYRVG